MLNFVERVVKKGAMVRQGPHQLAWKSMMRRVWVARRVDKWEGEFRGMGVMVVVRWGVEQVVILGCGLRWVGGDCRGAGTMMLDGLFDVFLGLRTSVKDRVLGWG